MNHTIDSWASFVWRKRGVCSIAALAATAAVAVGISGCEHDARPVVEETVSASSLALTGPAPTLPLSGTADYEESDDGGVSFSALHASFSSSNGSANINLTLPGGISFANVTLNSNGSQPGTDSFISPLTLYLDPLPNRGASFALGTTWETQLPAAYVSFLDSERNSGTSSYHIERVVEVKDIYQLSADVSIVRVAFAEHVVRTSSLGLEAQGLASGRLFVQRLGVADVAIGSGGTFQGRFITVRVAAITPEPAAPIAPTATFASVAAAPHSSVLSCATNVSGLPAAALTTLPSGGNLPLPTLFAQCP